MTDHRVGLTKGNLPGVLAGELDEFTAALEAEEKRRMLEAARAGGRMTVRDALDAAVTALDGGRLRHAAARRRAADRRRPRSRPRARS